MKILSLPFVLLLALLPGCTADAPPVPAEVPPADAEATAEALAVLREADLGAVREAFARLPETPHTRYVRTTQRDDAGALLAAWARTMRFATGTEAPTVVRVDSAGRFDFGYLGGFVEASAGTGTRADLPAYLLPEDPAYLAPRSRESFRYALHPDTVLWGRPAHVVEVTARPGTGDEQPIRRARLYVDRDAGVVVALVLERRSTAFFFREDSRLYAALRPARGGWHPFLTRFDTRLRMPFRPPQRFRTVTAYYAFG